MKPWEYLAFTCPQGLLFDELNKAGETGWECVAVLKAPTPDGPIRMPWVQAVMKRPLPLATLATEPKE